MPRQWGICAKTSLLTHFSRAPRHSAQSLPFRSVCVCVCVCVCICTRAHTYVVGGEEGVLCRDQLPSDYTKSLTCLGLHDWSCPQSFKSWILPHMEDAHGSSCHLSLSRLAETCLLPRGTVAAQVKGANFLCRRWTPRTDLLSQMTKALLACWSSCRKQMEFSRALDSAGDLGQNQNRVGWFLALCEGNQ